MAKCTEQYLVQNLNILVPCGRCLDCKKTRVSGWGYRLQQEAKYAETAWFLTLTFDTDSVPLIINPKTKKGYKTLETKQIQLWLKRIRKKQATKLKKLGQPPVPIRFYATGEYGPGRMRPHYHVAIFNLQLDVLLTPALARLALNAPQLYLDGKYHHYPDTWWNQELNQPIGNVTIGTLTPASAGYVLKYMTKPKMVPKYLGDPRLPESSFCSKGIGKQYLTPQRIRWHRADLLNRMYIPYENGKKIAVPPYYKKRIYSDAERQEIGSHLTSLQQEEEIKKLTRLTDEEYLRYRDTKRKHREDNKRKLHNQNRLEKVPVL